MSTNKPLNKNRRVVKKKASERHGVSRFRRLMITAFQLGRWWQFYSDRREETVSVDWASLSPEEQRAFADLARQLGAATSTGETPSRPGRQEAERRPLRAAGRHVVDLRD